MNKELTSIEIGEYKFTDYKRSSKNKNGDLYMVIETVITTLAGIVVARKIREYWTDHQLDRFYGKEYIFQTQTVVTDKIGYYSDMY